MGTQDQLPRNNYRPLRLMATVTFGLLMLAAPPVAAEGPPAIPNSIRYSDAGAKPGTGRSGSASLTVRALLGKDAKTDLELTTAELDGTAPAPGLISQAQVKAFNSHGGLLFTRTHNNYNGASGGGYLLLGYQDLVRGQNLQVQANVRGIDPDRADVVTADTRVFLRPDLQAVALNAPETAVVDTAVVIAATLRETNADVGARADAILLVDGEEVDRASGIWVDADGTVSCAFTHTFTTLGVKQLQIVLDRVTPGDYDPSNNRANAAIEIVPPTRPLSYSASVFETFLNRQEHYSVHYRAMDGSWASDYVQNIRNQLHQQGASVYFHTWNTVQFPLRRLSIGESADGVAVLSRSFGNVAPDSAYTTIVGTTRNLTKWDAALNSRVFLSTFAPSERYYWLRPSTFGAYFRMAGDVTFHSDGYSIYWYGGELRSAYSWNYEFGSRYGVFPKIGDRHRIEIAVDDGEAIWLADPELEVRTFEWQFDQPLTCREYGFGYATVLTCQQINHWMRSRQGSASRFQ